MLKSASLLEKDPIVNVGWDANSSDSQLTALYSRGRFTINEGISNVRKRERMLQE